MPFQIAALFFTLLSGAYGLWALPGARRSRFLATVLFREPRG